MSCETPLASRLHVSATLWRLPPRQANHPWSCDFVARRTADGRALRALNVMDGYIRVALGRHGTRRHYRMFGVAS